MRNLDRFLWNAQGLPDTRQWSEYRVGKEFHVLDVQSNVEKKISDILFTYSESLANRFRYRLTRHKGKFEVNTKYM